MNTQPFRPLYAQLTPEERVQLVLAAVARRDMDEVARLRDSCPRRPAVIGDPQYTELLQGIWLAGAGIKKGTTANWGHVTIGDNVFSDVAVSADAVIGSVDRTTCIPAVA